MNKYNIMLDNSVLPCSFACFLQDKTALLLLDGVSRPSTASVLSSQAQETVY